MDNVTIRPARKEDLPVLYTFEQGVISAERPFDVTLQQGEIHYYDLAAMIDDEHTLLLVAEADGRLVASGYANIRTGKPYNTFGKFAYLGFMYVAPEYRGKGINQRIIGALKAWAQAKGLNEMRLQVYHENRPALRAYEKMGFGGLLLEMRVGI